MSIATINPATGATELVVDQHSPEEVEVRLQGASDAARDLRRTSFGERATWMRATAVLLESELPQLAQLITVEMGKPIAQSEAEVAKSVRAMHYYADHAEEFLSGTELPEPASVGATSARTQWAPLGVILAVMPWNYPVWQVIRFAAPALMAGNAGLLKHASNVPQCAIYLSDLFERGGFPRGAFSTVLVGSSQVAALIEDVRVQAVTLTGSEPAGQAVAAKAGHCIKKTVLELGGSDPFVVMPSADLDLALATAVRARISNNGQSCIAAKRFIIHTDVYDEFVSRFVELMTALAVGDPMDRSTEIGPVATAGGLSELEALVEDARKKGAQVDQGSPGPEGGYFFPPTVVSALTPDMRLVQEEAFGPLATVYRVSDKQEALEIANQTSFGLSSAVWTAEEDEQRYFVEGIEAGAVFLNGMTVSYPELPFGGIKRSGYGRELAAAGIQEFCNLKTVWKS